MYALEIPIIHGKGAWNRKNVTQFICFDILVDNKVYYSTNLHVTSQGAVPKQCYFINDFKELKQKNHEAFRG